MQVQNADRIRPCLFVEHVAQDHIVRPQPVGVLSRLILRIVNRREGVAEPLDELGRRLGQRDGAIYMGLKVSK